MATADLSKATRELFIRSLVDQVYMRTPFIERLQKNRQVTYQGGTDVKKLVDTAEIDDLVQEYTVNQALTDEKKTTLNKPSFTMKYAQLPLRYDADEQFQNVTAGKEEQLLNLAAHLAKKGQRGTKLWLMKKAFNGGSTTGVADGATAPQSIVSALDHDITYGTLSRSWSGGTNDWWQGSDPAGLNENVTSSSQATAANLTISNLRKWIYETSISQNMESTDDLQVFMCATLYNKLRAEMESKMIYDPVDGGEASQGLTKMRLDKSIEIVDVPYLQTTSTMRLWVFILNMKYWELRIHTQRNFAMKDFKWQGDIANGHDYWLARIMWLGNIVCWKPNSSMWLSNIS